MHVSFIISRVLEICPEPTAILAGAAVVGIAIPLVLVLVLSGLVVIATLVALTVGDLRYGVHAREVLGDLLNALLALVRGWKQ